ncbi:glutamate synthase large subunit [Aciditerrimonas ferrireducens]|uniref:glutamate synthase large subunit n=1 Tax=Aciditerrimonas ferrireducens TaxID=667306 RepID=UPI0020047D71|nr:glutamate synthase large subunit [Aciditerrimonas ferrireducens]MCK4177861.1 glutamate synthase large subunit [Aciditerrimonas ferrireducens]
MTSRQASRQTTARRGQEGRAGLYDPAFEHDACGIALLADLQGRKSRRLVAQALDALRALAHRGATGAEPATGDGAGILVQQPDALWREVCPVPLPEAGAYASGLVFLPVEADDAAKAKQRFEDLAAEEDLEVLAWREVPVEPAPLGEGARRAMPRIGQVWVAPTEEVPRGAAGRPDALAVDRLAFCLRKRAEHELGVHLPSLSARTFVYKGMLTPEQLEAFYPDLADERLVSAIALVHSRFSTNTFPSWPLAHPYRYVAHNGEINTVRGNRNWMRAREALLRSDLIPGDLERLFPICDPEGSDSASFDEVLELLHLGGRSLPHAVLMMIPEAWERHPTMDPDRRAFYRFHASLMEPWDGPAAVVFTDGTVAGGVLDRNGLRPARYWVTEDGLVVLASEVGVLDLDPRTIVRKGRLQPGRMFLVDTAAGRIVDDDEIKAQLAAERPYGQWLEEQQVDLEDLPPRLMLTPQHASVVRHQRLFGYTTEELRVILAPMAQTGAEPVGSMGHDAALAVLSERPRLLYDYFTQLFAQVTNPALDAIREELVTATRSKLGPEGNLLEPTPASCRQIILPSPVIDNDELAKLRYVNEDGDVPGFSAFAVDGLYPVAGGGPAMAQAIEDVRRRVSEAIAEGANVIILSDRNSDAELAPIPSLLLCAAVHEHLVREKSRTRVGLVVEAGDAREVHHMALLLGYGASAVNPYLAFETIDDLIATGQLTGVTPRQARRNYVKAVVKGIVKVMSKMGVSTVASYTGAQIFEAVGLDRAVVDEYFTGTVSRIGGVGLDVLAEEVAARHRAAHPRRPESRAHRELEVGGEYQWRREGELHLFNPRTVFKLQHATRAKRYDIFKEYTSAVDGLSRKGATLRGLLGLRTGVLPPVPLEEVEPVSAIVKRFSTGAMSYGSISAEAHETLAIAMNRLGGKSNTGEGGEDPERFVPDPNGDSRRSAIKQVASGRFGVTIEYLVNADDIQIKIAQGAKPGEGGQLPGHKVYPWIARTRYSTPGVGLISPPPHHDIYSIEDIAQLIHDLKSANPRARVHVKLVAEVGVGTVAAGVAKAKADVVLISGHDGGTGASPLTSIKHAGIPWELGLAETQQTLVRNGLRDRIVVQVDGQMKTGRDVVVAALLGAEEFGFATAPLVVSGCVMMRVCHLDTCPVGIATQNPELRKRFSGRPEFVEHFFEFVAEEVRELLASLGLRSLDEAVGRVDLLDTVAAIDHWKAKGLDLSPVLAEPEPGPPTERRWRRPQDHGLERALDQQFLAACRPAIEDGQPVSLALPVRNVDRTVGTLLASEIARRHGGAGLPEGTISITFRGSAGQSFGAFLPRGVTFRLEGDANDYLAKGLSGGRIVVRPPEGSPFAPEEQVIVGNVVLYGATGGEVFVSGLAGERFCVRNSGALAVVEGVGDHGCEYMTGGRVVVLGPVGRNFAAGMSGGIAYVHDPEATLAERLNPELVDLEPLDEEDEAFLATVVRRHQEETGSPLAARLLEKAPGVWGRFVKVMPRDYRRVLEATREAEAKGQDPAEAVMALVRA